MVEKYREGVRARPHRWPTDEADDLADIAAYHAALDGSRGWLLHEGLAAVIAAGGARQRVHAGAAAVAARPRTRREPLRSTGFWRHSSDGWRGWPCSCRRSCRRSARRCGQTLGAPGAVSRPALLALGQHRSRRMDRAPRGHRSFRDPSSAERPGSTGSSLAPVTTRAQGVPRWRFLPAHGCHAWARRVVSWYAGVAPSHRRARMPMNSTIVPAHRHESCRPARRPPRRHAEASRSKPCCC